MFKTKNTKFKKVALLSTSALVAALSFSPAYAAPQEIDNAIVYNGNAVWAEGFQETSGGLTIASLTLPSQNNIGIGTQGVPGTSLLVNNNSNLWLNLVEEVETNNAIVFVNDVTVEEGSRLKINSESVDVEFQGVVNSINILSVADADISIMNDFTGGVIEISGDGASIFTSAQWNENNVSLVNVDINSIDDTAKELAIRDTIYNGTINLGAGNDDIDLQFTTELAGDVNFGDGDDRLYSYMGDSIVSGIVDFGAGDDLLSIEDDSMTITGSLLNLEEINAVWGGKLIINSDVTISKYLMVDYATVRIGAGKTLTADTSSFDSATLVFDIASPTSAGLLVLENDVIDLTGSTVEANVTGAPGLFANGATIKVAQGNGALIGFDGETGLEATTIVEQSAMFGIKAMDGSKLGNPLSANDLYLVFDQEHTIEEIAEGSQNKQVGAVLDDISGTSNPELAEVISNINAGNQQQVNQIISTLTPTPDVIGSAASQNFVNNTLDITAQRLSDTGASSGDSMSGLRPWLQLFGQRTDQGERGGHAGYDAKGFGVAIGIDTESLVENATIGTVFSYGDTNVDSRNTNRTDTDINSYQLTAYANYILSNNNFLKGMAAYSYNDIGSTRHDVGGIGLDAEGDYSANIYTLRAEAGKNLNYGKTRITPSLMAHYSHYDAEGYTEQGAGGAGLKVGSSSLNVFELGTGIEAGWDIKNSDGSTFAPEIRAGYRYDLIGDKANVSSSFIGGGSSFSTEGITPARGTLSLGGGITYYTASSWEFSANYEFEHKSDYTSNAGIARAAYKF